VSGISLSRAKRQLGGLRGAAQAFPYARPSDGGDWSRTPSRWAALGVSQECALPNAPERLGVGGRDGEDAMGHRGGAPKRATVTAALSCGEDLVAYAAAACRARARWR
jgi:hypothetical protein